LFVYNLDLGNSNALTAIRHMFAQMGSSGFNYLCGPHLDWSRPTMG